MPDIKNDENNTILTYTFLKSSLTENEVTVSLLNSVEDLGNVKEQPFFNYTLKKYIISGNFIRNYIYRKNREIVLLKDEWNFLRPLLDFYYINEVIQTYNPNDIKEYYKIGKNISYRNNLLSHGSFTFYSYGGLKCLKYYIDGVGYAFL